MADNRNPLLPDTADNSNLTNRSGTTREAVADAASREMDRDEVDDLRAASSTSTVPTNLNATAMGSAYNTSTPVGSEQGSYASGSRYYSPVEGREHLSGFFDSREEAQDAVHRLEALGVPRSDISLVFRDDEDGRGRTVVTDSTGSHAGEGAGTGSIIGGTLGAILGALAATATSVVIPGVGILIAGPIAGALAGAGAGGLTGGVLGALVGAGIPEETARTYESGIHRGGVVVVADVPAHLAAQARIILNTAY
jgi:hypothetical protein